MGLFAAAKPVLVVDVAAVLKAKGVRGHAAPRQQLQILRALSRVAQRENIKVTAVLTGTPLDKAPHNKIVDQVRVRYAKSDETLNKELIKGFKQAGATGVLVTGDVALENRIIRSGGQTLRVSTFRKLLDDGNEPNDNAGGNSDGNRSQRKNRRDRGPRKNRGDRPKQTQSDQENGPRNEADAISQMIDLVE